MGSKMKKEEDQNSLRTSMGSKMNFDKGLHFGNNLLFSFNKIIDRAHGP
jgi:hypothetical protein